MSKYKKQSFKYVLCSRCQINEMKISEDAIGGICSQCVQVKIGPPLDLLKEKKEAEKRRLKRPRGWQFMKEFVDIDGNVYYKGEEQPDLKGTLSPTKVEPKKKKNKKSGFDKIAEEERKQKMLVKRFKAAKKEKNNTDEKSKTKRQKGRKDYSNKPKKIRHKK